MHINIQQSSTEGRSSAKARTYSVPDVAPYKNENRDIQRT